MAMPSILNPQQPTPRLSHLNPQPSTLNREASTLNPEPWMQAKLREVDLPDVFDDPESPLRRGMIRIVTHFRS